MLRKEKIKAGDSIDIFAAGEFIETIDDGKTEINGLYYRNSESCADGSCTFSDGIGFEYNDIENDRKDALRGVLEVIYADDEYLNEFVEAATEGMDGSLDEVIREGQHGGSLDFNSSKKENVQVPGYKLTITDSHVGGTRAYNVADLGNYLTGMSLKKLGYGSVWGKIFGHGNNIIFGPRDHGSRERSGWLDSMGDQRALRNGFGHYK